MDAQEIKARLLTNLEGFLAWLMPAGKVVGHEFRVGDVAGVPGKSLAVNLRGEKAGLWQDFATGDKGDVFDLFCQNRNIPFKDGLPEIARWLGITMLERPKPKPKPKADFKTDVSGMSGTPVYKYLHEVRGIQPETMKAYRLRSHKRSSASNTDFICFQFFDTEGDPVMLKSTGIKKNANGTKDIWTTAPYYTLWGWWTVKTTDRQIIITEGEIDAMSVFQLEPGMPVLSMPSGASNLTWIDNDYHALQTFERIYICADADEAGDKASREIAKRLGATRCLRLPLPLGYKDANEVLTKGHPEELEISKWFERATSYDPPSLRGAYSYLDAAKRRLLRWQEEDTTNTFVFPSVPFHIRAGESTLLTGISSHGKSELAYQILGHEMRNGEKCCVCSLEIDPDEMMLNMTTQLLGHSPKAEELERAFAWFDGKLWFLQPKEDLLKSNTKPLFDDMAYASRRFGCSRFLVDSLLFVTRKDDYEGQDVFCKTIKDFDRYNDSHTFLIAHASTKKDENAVPRLADIQGSTGIIAPFSNILIMWRNVEKEEKLAKAKEDGDQPEVEKMLRTHDGMLFIAKQRHTGKRSKTKLFFNSTSRCFRTTPDLPPPAPSDQELF